MPLNEQEAIESAKKVLPGSHAFFMAVPVVLQVADDESEKGFFVQGYCAPGFDWHKPGYGCVVTQSGKTMKIVDMAYQIKQDLDRPVFGR